MWFNTWTMTTARHRDQTGTGSQSGVCAGKKTEREAAWPSFRSEHWRHSVSTSRRSVARPTRWLLYATTRRRRNDRRRCGAAARRFPRRAATSNAGQRPCGAARKLLAARALQRENDGRRAHLGGEVVHRRPVFQTRPLWAADWPRHAADERVPWRRAAQKHRVDDSAPRPAQRDASRPALHLPGAWPSPWARRARTNNIHALPAGCEGGTRTCCRRGQRNNSSSTPLHPPGLGRGRARRVTRVGH